MAAEGCRRQQQLPALPQYLVMYLAVRRTQLVFEHDSDRQTALVVVPSTHEKDRVH